MTEADAVKLMDGGGARLAVIRQQTLACGTFYLAADVREKAKTGTLLTERELPELMGAKEAAACLGVRGPNLYKVLRGADVPQQKTDRGTVYLADAVRELKRLRDAPAPPRVCPKHGNEDMRASRNGKRTCAVCNRERKRALLADSVRREEYNRQRRERYRSQREAEVAS